LLTFFDELDPTELVAFSRQVATHPTQSWAFMPLLRAYFRVPPRAGDALALSVLRHYWPPALDITFDEALDQGRRLVVNLFQAQRQAIEPLIQNHVDGRLQELLLGDVNVSLIPPAVTPGNPTRIDPAQDREVDWVAGVRVALRRDQARSTNLLFLTGRVNLAINNLKAAHRQMR
jgi:hypothetical protein